jgi:hypothetical protein
LRRSSASPVPTSKSRSHRAGQAIQHRSLQLPIALARCWAGDHSTTISPPSLVQLSLGNRNCDRPILPSREPRKNRVNPVLAIYSLLKRRPLFQWMMRLQIDCNSVWDACMQNNVSETFKSFCGAPSGREALISECARCGFLTHGIAVHFERRAAAAEIDAVAGEVLTAERKPDAHRVPKRPGEATGVVLTVAVSPHRRIEHRG